MMAIPHNEKSKYTDNQFDTTPAFLWTVDQKLNTMSRFACLFRMLTSDNKELSWCWQTRATRLEVSLGHQT